MSMQNIVTPGDKVCVEEEFIPQAWTYVENGDVRALVVGRPVFDIINRRVYVKPLKSIEMPKSGDIVIGVVEQMRDEIAIIRFIGYDANRTFKHSFRGVLHISQASNTRIQNLYEVIRLGDIVRVKILNNYIPYLVTLKDAKLGVIEAFCSRCGAPLYRDRSKDVLRCRVCGNIESRKIAPDYVYTLHK